MKDFDYYKTSSNTQIQQSKIRKVLNKKYSEDYLADGLKEVAEVLSYCCRNYKSEMSCKCKWLCECKLFNELILKYSELLKQYREIG